MSQMNNHNNYDVAPRKRYGFGHLLFDVIMVIATGGLWRIWILIRTTRSNTR